IRCHVKHFCRHQIRARDADSLFLIMEEIQDSTPLVNDIKQLIAHSREKVAATVNAEITLLYWLVGKRINDEILNNSRAEYGKQIIDTLAQHLTQEYGGGWSQKQL